MGKIVRFYQAEDGKTPAKEFLDSLIHEEDTEDASEGNREGGNLQRKLSAEAQAP